MENVKDSSSETICIQQLLLPMIFYLCMFVSLNPQKRSSEAARESFITSSRHHCPSRIYQTNSSMMRRFDVVMLEAARESAWVHCHSYSSWWRPEPMQEPVLEEPMLVEVVVELMYRPPSLWQHSPIAMGMYSFNDKHGKRGRVHVSSSQEVVMPEVPTAAEAVRGPSQGTWL
ncbi:hypothetical protein CDL15_Pgr022769 [Punica granatum]|uniref:Uncharacterized protein n=1 Tax=Punica granatum TaxID=22663 RepID=A0A218XSM0_PUNGR|nr:hypothetical protein CDL15_Pgr022769 [Punica granatum]